MRSMNWLRIQKWFFGITVSLNVVLWSLIAYGHVHQYFRHQYMAKHCGEFVYGNVYVRCSDYPVPVGMVYYDLRKGK